VLDLLLSRGLDKVGRDHRNRIGADALRVARELYAFSRGHGARAGHHKGSSVGLFGHDLHDPHLLLAAQRIQLALAARGKQAVHAGIDEIVNDDP